MLECCVGFCHENLSLFMDDACLCSQEINGKQGYRIKLKGVEHNLGGTVHLL